MLNLYAGGREQNDKDGRKSNQGHRDEHFDWCLVRFFFSTLTALYTHLVRLNAQDFRQADTQTLALDYSGHKARHFSDANPLCHIPQCITPWFSQLNLSNHA